jgi:methionine-rich copper-binding protein CopC
MSRIEVSFNPGKFYTIFQGVPSKEKGNPIHTFLKASFLAGVVGLAMSGQAMAHAHLTAATPAIAGIVAASPTELDLKFSEAINLKFSDVKVTSPDGTSIATGTVSLPKDDESTLIVPVPATLAAGTYTVDWHVLSKDGHKTHGSYRFTVKP